MLGCFSSGASKCDTQVYLTWRGTDRKGAILMSDNYRLSNFGDYSISTLMGSVNGVLSSIYNSLKSLTL